MSKEVNVKSSTLEKGLELAKEFVGKLIGPTIEEVGLLMADKVKFYRYKNQIKILLKAKKFVEERKLSTKEIPLKILVPLLETASLEEDKEMQDKWANMIANLADSEQDLQSQVFTFVLSQISKNEMKELRKLYLKEHNGRDFSFALATSQIQRTLKKKEHRLSKDQEATLEKALIKISKDGFKINLNLFESSNLERLGLIKQIPPKVLIETSKTEKTKREKENKNLSNLTTKYDRFTYKLGYRITQLGFQFIEITYGIAETQKLI